MKKLKKLSDYYCHLRKLIVSGGAALLTLFMCFSSPAVYASDISIYQAAKNGTITLMLMLDTSGSMGPTKSSSGYSFADDYGLTNCGTSSQTTLPTNGNSLSSFSNNTAYYVTSSTTPSYSRNFCYVSSSAATTTVKNSCELQSNGGYRCYDRLTRLKDGVFDLLNGNATKNITALSDDKIIGLSTFSYNGEGNAGYIVVPALSLGSTVGTITQRQTLLNAISILTATGGTPTANSYAEVGAYMMGTNTTSSITVQVPMYFKSSFLGLTYKCASYDVTGCTDWSYTLFDLAPSGSTYVSCTIGSGWSEKTGSCVYVAQALANPYSGFSSSDAKSKNSSGTAYLSPINTSTPQCSGQGIYILTDGEPNNSGTSIAQPLMQAALGSYGSSLTCAGTLDSSYVNKGASGAAWSCIADFSQLLLNRNIDGTTATNQMNPLGVPIKTALVGFGSDFSGIPAYNSALPQITNINNINNANVTGSFADDVKNAAKLGVYGQGGWYLGSNSSDVVNSVNSFINTLSTNIPPVTTGSATIPVDKLNPTAVQNYAYFSQFQPTPDKTYQLWQGNLKKYNVLNGYITDASGNSVVDSTGKIVTNTDLWAGYATTSDLTAYGGVKGVLPLGANSSNTANRTLLIDRDSSGNTTGTTLNQINVSYLNTTTDSARGYLLALLGFAVDPNNLPTSTSTLISSGELRQIGAVMHSAPILLTSSGTITTNTDGPIGTSNRSDYALFGSTQGLLHVVDATTGTEKFAFVPNEMVTKQKNAFLKYDSTTGGTAALYYGVDAPWEVYSEYVPNADGSLTVGTGMGGATGKQMAYGGLRMGGRSYYALNLQNISSPSITFHIDPDGNKLKGANQVWYNGSSTTYKELAFMGQSWSKPSIGWVRWNGSKRLVMFVGGGYDAGGTNGDGTFATDGSRTGYAGYEGTTYSQTNKIGAGVYMFDALTGQLLWWTGANATASNTTAGVQYTTAANMQYSVVSQIKTVDRNSDGLIDHLYFGDLGGQVWRVDLNNNAPAVSAFAKTPVRLLNLNNGQYSPRFYQTPGFSTYSSSGTIFGVVSIGSGNLSSPLFDTASSSNSNYNNDAIYNIYDKDVARSDLYNYTTTTSGGTTSYSYSSSMNTHDLTLATSTASPTMSQLLPLTDTTRASNATIVAPYATTGGWYYAFASSMIQDEKVLSTPLVINNDMYVTTFDGSKDGLSGTCGAGVKGNSFVTQFCMPYGQCSSSVYTSSSFINHTNIGAGIVAPSVGSTNSTGSTRTLVTASGNLSSSRKIYSTSLSLIPQRWYETSQ